MLINNVSSLNSINFKSQNRTKFEKVSNSNIQTPKNKKRLTLALCGLAVAGVVIAGGLYIKKSNKTLNELAQGIKANASKKLDNLLKSKSIKTDTDLSEIQDKTTPTSDTIEKAKEITNESVGTAISIAKKAKTAASTVAATSAIAGILFEKEEDKKPDTIINYPEYNYELSGIPSGKSDLKDEDVVDVEIIEPVETAMIQKQHQTKHELIIGNSLFFNDKKRKIYDKNGKEIARTQTREKYSGTYNGQEVVIELKTVSIDRVENGMDRFYRVIRDAKTNKAINITRVNIDGEEYKPNEYGKSSSLIKQQEKYTDKNGREIVVTYKNGTPYSLATTKHNPDGSKVITVDYGYGIGKPYEDTKVIYISKDGKKSIKTLSNKPKFENEDTDTTLENPKVYFVPSKKGAKKSNLLKKLRNIINI